MSSPAGARTLLVGQGRDYRLPSEALAAAAEGDVVSVAPGEYFDCSIIRTDGVTLLGEGEGAPAAMTDKVCEGKAVLVLRANNVTVRNMTLQRARVPDGNGAGIRLENQVLTVDRVRFKNNQVGILSGMQGGIVTVTGSRFEGGGVGGVPPRYALMIGRSDRLRVDDCTFADVKGGGIITAADRSEIAGNTIDVGAGDPEEPPAFAVLATDGTLAMRDNAIAVGPLAPAPGAAIGAWDDSTARLTNNRLSNRSGQPVALLQDWSWHDPVLAGNTVGAGDQLVSTGGLWRHRASREFYTRKAQAREFASFAKRTAKQWLGR